MGAAFMGAGLLAQYFNQRNATNRGQAAATAGINDQGAYQTQANNAVAKQTQQVASDTPNAIANSENANFVNTLRKNVNAPGSSALAPVPGANSRYNSDTAASKGAVQSFGDTNAGEMSAIDAAVRQRQNEALSAQTLGTTLNSINAASQSKAFVDQLRTAQVSQQNPGVSLFSKMATAGGAAMAQNGNAFSWPGSGSTTDPAALGVGNGTTPSGYLSQGGYLVKTPGQ